MGGPGRGWGAWVLIGLAAALPCGRLASAQPAPALMETSEVLRLELAAGFRNSNGKVLNACGKSADPRIGFIDLSSDGRPEAIVVDSDPACYGPPGDWFAILKRDAVGDWRVLARGAGTVGFGRTRTHGWLDVEVTGACSATLRFNGAAYAPDHPCAAAQPALAAGAAAPIPAAGLSAADQAAAMRAAGFVPKGKTWTGCDGHSVATIAPADVRDINGDGLIDAVIVDEGTDCYGATGQGFTIVSKGPDGQWRKIFASPGIAEFQRAEGPSWPDLMVGGPGFCFPVLRWNGTTYVFHHNKEERRGACRR